MIKYKTFHSYPSIATSCLNFLSFLPLNPNILSHSHEHSSVDFFRQTAHNYNDLLNAIKEEEAVIKKDIQSFLPRKNEASVANDLLLYSEDQFGSQNAKGQRDEMKFKLQSDEFYTPVDSNQNSQLKFSGYSNEFDYTQMVNATNDISQQPPHAGNDNRFSINQHGFVENGEIAGAINHHYYQNVFGHDMGNRQSTAVDENDNYGRNIRNKFADQNDKDFGE